MLRCLFLLCSLCCLFTEVSAQGSPCSAQHCLAVVDAGSTASRLHVYAYDLDKTNTPIHIQDLLTKQITPGLNGIEASQTSIDNYLNNLFKDTAYDNLPLYFYATAGMRLLPTHQQKTYFQGISNWFGKQKRWKLQAVKTITGKEEGFFDWLAVNYYLGSLNTGKPVGVMDFGGASVQVVFPVDKISPGDEKNSLSLTLYGRTTLLSIHSFLGLGQTEMSHQFLNRSLCYAREYPLPNGDKGEGNGFACKTAVSSLVDDVQEVNKIIPPLLQANPVKDWYAIGALANLAESPLFPFSSHEFSLQSLLEEGDKKVCTNTWDNLNKAYPNDDYVYQFCLFSAYFYALIVEGYGISPNQLLHVLPTKQHINWTLGVVLSS